MFKLLTDEEKQKVQREYVMRRAVVMLSGFVLVLVVGIIGLLPSYLLSNVRQYEALERTRIMGSVGQRGDESYLQTWLAKINLELQLLSPELDKDRPSDFIEQVLEQKIAGISLIDFSWVKVKDKLSFSVNGVASDRQALITFENRIKSSQHFSEVTLPISNLAQDRNINFQMKFSPVSTATTLQTL